MTGAPTTCLIVETTGSRKIIQPGRFDVVGRKGFEILKIINLNYGECDASSRIGPPA